MTPTLKLSVRSCARIWFRTNRERMDRTGKGPPRYCRERCGFDTHRWLKYYGKEQFANGIKELFSNP